MGERANHQGDGESKLLQKAKNRGRGQVFYRWQ